MSSSENDDDPNYTGNRKMCANANYWLQRVWSKLSRCRNLSFLEN